MELNVLGFIILFVGLLVAYVAYIGYITYWYLIGTKVERDFETMIECQYEDGSKGYTHGYCFMPTRFNNFVWKQYIKKFGA